MRPLNLRSKLFLLTAIVVFASCGDGTVDDNNNQADGSLATDGSLLDGSLNNDITGADSAVGEDSTAQDVVADVSIGADSSSDTTTSSDTGGDCPGADGCPCASDDDCDSKKCAADTEGGEKVCQPGCKPTDPADEVCDGVDNDCDGQTDNDTCDDANPCTTNVCEQGADDKYACSATPANDGTSCDDGDACTNNDACSSGACSGDKLDCDDSNPCTDDSCDAAKGCQNANNAATCDDGDVCTEGEACADGKCAGSAAKNCDDGNACTKDSCDATSGCVNADDDAAGCDDGDQCTDKDSCSGGLCTAGAQKSCDDGNACTNDVCNSNTGKCESKSIQDGGACDDGKPCTDNDTCDATGCTGTIKVCDDGSPCTTDSCDPVKGCVTQPAEGDCDDGSKCTSVDKCVNGVCTGSGGKDCDDNNPCSLDGCDPSSGECTHKAQAGACDDGSKCTDKDACAEGKCTGVAVKCDDGNVCTDDSCDAAAGCKNDSNSETCDDGNACTDKDVCSAGECKPGANICQCKTNEDCKDDGNLCNGIPVCENNKCVTDPSSVVTCDASKDTTCLTNQCAPATGKCAPKATNEGKVCSEGNPCTVGNTCSSGLCTSSGKPKCDDGNACTLDGCDVKTGACKNAPIDGCVPCKDATVCDDKNPCTKDSCVSGKCSFALVDGCSLAPDLKPTSAVKTDKTSYLAGQSGVASYSVTNLGLSAAAGRVDTVYLSTNKTIDKGDLAIGKISAGSLGGKKLQLVDVKVLIPTTVKSGTYFLIAQVDSSNVIKEADETNNVALGSVAVKAMPDLTITAMKPDVTATYAGGKVTFSLNIANIGGISAAASTAQFYLSKNATIETTDVKPYKWTVGLLASGTSWTGSKFVTIPAGTANGTWYVGLRVDDTNIVKEGSELNNVQWTKIAVGPAPDLNASAFSAFSSTMKAGNSYTLAATEKNIGDKDAGPYTSTIYLSPVAGLSKGMVKLVDVPRKGLSKDGIGTYKVVANIPATTVTGTYYLVFRVDSANAIAEKNEGNNLKWVKISVAGRPDLIPATTLPNAKGWMVGSKGSVSYTESNVGSGDSVAYTSRFFLSTNQTYGGSGDVALTEHVKRGALKAKTSSLAVSQSFTIPANTVPGKYFLIHRVDSSSQNAEANESNNNKPVAVEILSKPNLVVSAFLVGTAITAGTSIKAAYTLTNKGGSVAGASVTRFYLSTDAVYSSTDVLIGSASAGSVAGNSSAQLSAVLTIPAPTKAGKYYIVARADATAKVAESSELDNFKAAATTIGAAKLPDLKVISTKLTSTKTSFKPGETIYLSVIIKNEGNVSSGSYGIGRYLSTNSGISPSDTALGAPLLRASLSAGQQTTYVVALPLPLTAKPGSFYVGVSLDPTQQIAEIYESNNSGVGMPIKVLAVADLVADSITTTKAFYKPGETVNFTVKHSNVGTAAAGAHSLSVRLSTNISITPQDPQVKSQPITSLAIGASKLTTSAFVLPKDQKAGDLYVGVMVDYPSTVAEISESNNIKYVKITVQDLASLKADLIPDAIKPSATVISAGKTLSWTGVERNIGNVSALGHEVRVYLSKSTSSVVGATLLKTIPVKGLAAGSSVSVAGSYTLSPSFNAGSYYLHVRADHGGVVNELLESNNIKNVAITVQGLANLKVASMNVSKTYYKAGETVSVSWVESNTGAVASGAYNTGIYLSGNSSITTLDKLVKTSPVKGLVAGGLASFTTTFTMPTGLAAGTWYIGVLSDNGGAVAESVESDNARSVSISVQSTSKAPDLYVESVSTTASTYNAGSIATVNGTVRNIGFTSATSFRVGYYLSGNSTINTADTLLGTKTFASLSAGASGSLLRYVTIPLATKAGTYYVGAFADDQFKIAESAENNNSRGVTVKVNPVVDLKAVSISAGDFYKPGATGTATVKYSNLGGAAAGSHTVTVYLSNDSIITTSDTKVGSYLVKSMAGPTSSSLSVGFTLPATVATGTKYLGVIVDSASQVKEYSESNNRAYKTITVQPPATAPDLIPYLFGTKATSYKVGDTITWTGNARNIGLSTSISHVNRVLLCPTAVATSACLTLKSVTQAGLAANTNASIAGSWKVANSVANGTWYLIASVDHTKQVKEMFESNNVKAIQLNITGLADLSADYLALDKATIYPGQYVKATMREKNVGGQATPTAYKSSFYLSTNTTINALDTKLKEVSRVGLQPGVVSSTTAFSMLIPTATKPGVYYLGLYANSPSTFTETTSSNNTKYVKITVLEPKPDIVITGAKLTTASNVAVSSLVRGQTYKLTCIMSNSGTLGATKVGIRAYTSADALITTSDSPIGNAGVVDSMPKGNTVTYNFSVYINPKGFVVGQKFYIGCYGDYMKVIPELNELNNGKSTGGVLTIAK